MPLFDRFVVAQRGDSVGTGLTYRQVTWYAVLDNGNEVARYDEREKATMYARRRNANPDCQSCARTELSGPSHDAMPHCRSGKRPHCTCDGCF